MPYSVKDVIALPVLIVGVFLFIKFLYIKLENNKKKICLSYTDKRISAKLIFGVMLCLFLAWLPYLLVYYPGFIFSDSIASIQQALGSSEWNNHHPVMYSFFIKVCLKIGRTIADNTLGCAIYSVVQMFFMAYCFAYQFCWITVRAGIRKRWIALLTLILGLTPYVAQMSIAMWKDPIFSVTIIIISLMLMDVVLSKGKIFSDDKFFYIKYCIFSFILMFSRNNGIYIMLFIILTLMLLIIIYRRDKISRAFKIMTVLTIMLVAITKIVTGPIYDNIGIKKEPVEAYGIFLNQMARVVAYDGELSNKDKVYMDAILPIEQYKEKYRPCCTDLLKWDSEFHAEVLETGFFKTYFSILIKNPKICLEAWELETFGFWTVNQESINTANNNITGGVPRNTAEDGGASLNQIGIECKNLLKLNKWRDVFTTEDIPIPVGLVNWVLLLLICFFIMKKRYSYLVSLAPSFGVFLTLAIASPIFYWQRYGAAEQFSLPLYLILFLTIHEESNSNIKG